MTTPNVSITLAASDQTKQAFESVNRSLGELSSKSALAGQATNAAFGSLSGSTRAAIQNASYQISDFVVQVQGGTAASRALGQQLPQLLAGFGAFGAVAGIVAGFAPQIVEFFKSGDDVKPLTDSVKDLNGALSGIADVTMKVDMKPLYEQFNAANAAARGGIVSLLEYKKTLADVSAGMAETSLSKELKDLANLGTLDKLIGGDKAIDVAKKFGVEISVARDLLADARSGIGESTLLAERYATALAKGSEKGRELAAALVSAAKGSRDAAAAQTAISEAMVKIQKAGDTGIIPVGDKKPAKTGNAEASAEATAYGKAMEQLATMTRDADGAQLSLTKSQKTMLDLMSSAEWQDMPEAWKQTAVAQFEQSHAAEKAADATKRLNDLLGATQSAGIERAQSDMLLLTAALEKGIITEAKYLEAVDARLNGTAAKAKEATDQLDVFAKNAARNMQSSLADFLFDPFANGTKNMGQQFGDMLRRMAAEAAAANIARGLFGTMGEPGKNGGSGDWGFIGKASTWIGSFFEDGGIMTKDGAVPLRQYAGGGVATSPQLAMFGEGSTPEAYVPLPDGRRIPVAMQGGNDQRPIVINITSSAGDKAEIRRSAASGARTAMAVMGGAQRYA